MPHEMLSVRDYGFPYAAGPQLLSIPAPTAPLEPFKASRTHPAGCLDVMVMALYSDLGRASANHLFESEAAVYNQATAATMYNAASVAAMGNSASVAAVPSPASVAVAPNPASAAVYNLASAAVYNQVLAAMHNPATAAAVYGPASSVATNNQSLAAVALCPA